MSFEKDARLSLDTMIRGAIMPFVERAVLREQEILLDAIEAAQKGATSPETRKALKRLYEMFAKRRYYAEANIIAFVEGRSEADKPEAPGETDEPI